MKQKWKYDGRAHTFGEYSRVISRKKLEECGIVLAFLDHEAKWRASCDNLDGSMHWRWHATLAKAKEYAELLERGIQRQIESIK